MPSRRENNKTAVRAQIIAAAAQLFGAQPYDAVQMDDVARTASIGKPTLYRYFPSKEDLFLLITEMALKHVVEALGECRDSAAEAPDKLRAMVEALTGALGSSFVSLRVLSGENPPLAARWRNLFRRHREAIMAIFAEVLKAGAASGHFRVADADLTPAMIVGMVRGALMAVPDAPRTRVAASVTDLVISGVARANRR